MTKKAPPRWPDHGIRATLLPKTLTSFAIDPSEQQVIDNRTGPRLQAPRAKKVPVEQTSWLNEPKRKRGGDAR